MKGHEHIGQRRVPTCTGRRHLGLHPALPGATQGRLFYLAAKQYMYWHKLEVFSSTVRAIGNIYNVKGNEHTGQRGVRLEADAAVQAKTCTT